MQQLTQVNGTPTGTNQQDVNQHKTHVNEEDIATVQTNNRQQFDTELNQEEDLEAEDYFPGGEYEDEDIVGYNYENDNGVDLNLFRGPPWNFHNTSTGYVPTLSSQQDAVSTLQVFLQSQPTLCD